MEQNELEERETRREGERRRVKEKDKERGPWVHRAIGPQALRARGHV